MSKSSSIWSPIYIQLMLFETCCQFGVYLINPIVANFAVALGASVAIGGFLNGLNPLASFLFRPFAGLFLKNTDRRVLLFIAASIFEVSVLICALFPSLMSLTASRIIMGVAFVIKSALVIAVASDITPRESVGQAVGWIGLTGLIAGSLGPAIGQSIGVAVGYRFTFATSAVLFVIAIVLIKTLKRAENEVVAEEMPKMSIRERFAQEFHLKKMFHLKTFPLAGVCFFEAYLFGAVCGLLLLTGELRGIEGMSQWFIVYTIAAVAIRPLSNKAYDKYGLPAVFYPEAILMTLSPIFLAFANDMLFVYLSGACMALGQGCVYPSMQAETVKYVAAEDAAIAVNTFYIGPDIGMAVGPMVSGLVLELFGAEIMFLTVAASGVIFMIMYIFFYRWQKKMLAHSTKTNGTNPII